MHRYRDAIVYQNGASPYERTMFGAYVLFPYSDLERYKTHRFYRSIEEVNIGGLPFLPSATELVAQMLEELIADSPDSAFERATLPRGIEEKLMKVDWENRDVLVGSLRSKAQLDVALRHNFYHIPASQFPESAFPIHYVAIYQSKNFFGPEAGIRYYGFVFKGSAACFNCCCVTFLTSFRNIQLSHSSFLLHVKQVHLIILWNFHKIDWKDYSKLF